MSTMLQRAAHAFAAFAGVETKSAGAHVVAPGIDRLMQHGRPTFWQLAREAYLANEAVYSGIRVIMDNFITAPLRVWTEQGPIDGRALENDPLRAVFASPNPHRTEASLAAYTIMCLYLSGNMFWEVVRSRAGRVVEFWPLRPDRVLIVPDANNYIAGYIYTVNGQDFPLLPEDVVHFKFESPLDDYFGVSPLVAAARSIDTDNAINVTAKATLENGGVPAFAAFVDEIEDEAHLERLASQFKKKYGGNNRGAVGFFDRIKDLKPIGMNFNELAFKDLRYVSEARIYSVLRVPPITAGAGIGLENATYSNAEQFRALLHEDVIAGLHGLIAGTLAHKLKADLGRNVLAYDESEVPALRALRWKERDTAKNEWDAGLITRNEYRRRVGMPEDGPAGDVYKYSFTTTLIPAKEALPPPAPADPAPAPPSDPPADPTPAPEPKAAKRMARQGKVVKVDFGGPLVWTPSKSGVVRASQFNGEGKGCSCLHKGASTGLSLLSGPLGRVANAVKLRDKVAAWAKAEFRYEMDTVKAAMERRSGKSIDRIQVKELTQSDWDEVMMEMAEWPTHAAKTATPVLGQLLTEAVYFAAGEVGIDWSIESDDALNFIRSYTFKFADKYAETSRADVRAVMARSREESLTNQEIRKALDDQLGEWEGYRVDRIARSETIRSSNAAAIETYRRAGISTMAWVTSSEACPYCAPMDGVKVHLDEPFFKLGDRYQPDKPADWPEDEDVPAMKIDYEDVQAPPLHPNCECTIQAVLE